MAVAMSRWQVHIRWREWVLWSSHWYPNRESPITRFWYIGPLEIRKLLVPEANCPLYIRIESNQIVNREATNLKRGIMERRIHPRVEVTYPVFYRPDILTRPKVASTLDLSVGGARVETLYLLIEGDRLEISIAINSKVIKSRGHVVHTEWPVGKRLKAGVQFEEISKEDGLYLSEYISSVADRRDQTYLGG